MCEKKSEGKDKDRSVLIVESWSVKEVGDEIQRQHWLLNERGGGVGGTNDYIGLMIKRSIGF